MSRAYMKVIQMPDLYHIVVGQRITTEKKTQSKQLRLKMTPAEQLLWQHLRANQLEGLRFRRQQIIDGYIVDFYCHRARLVVEVGGGVHALHTDSDQVRDERLTGRGLTVLRLTNDEVLNNLPDVITRIREACHHASDHECAASPLNLSPSPSPARGGELAECIHNIVIQ